MYSSEENKRDCYCTEFRDRHPHAILFSILNRKDSCHLGDDNRNYCGMHNCHCEQRKLVCLRNSERTCQAASEVLVKTIHFMKSLPSFHHLPRVDQVSLLRGCWAPLFVLGLAQERMVFEVTDIPTASILRNILLNNQKRAKEQEPGDSPPTLEAAHNLSFCLNKLWSLDLTPKEYAYLKGAILFNPDAPGLMSSRQIEGLQLESHRVLHEVIQTLHPNDHGRFTCIRLAASSLQTVAQSFVTELFFRPVIGQTDLLDLLTEILFS
ncbi:nuclear receptor subfamily 0, group B, member 2b [Brachyhypopomus gauderio]|uniref:nuclear receptor subfamily 0, group B, member 2b n=1 Tax=Brachyhypopomus gauderio TaxID=698409 RepID=UPI00404197F7